MTPSYCAAVSESIGLSSRASRREALRMVDVLREIFDLERSWREGPDSDEYEQIQVTAFPHR